ncbi:hypothetical protein, partial [Lysinibacillus sp. fls2-241-R2A-57]|uniref:hypothetical protein n=1 Tax=Lysinibacillus sp. fls2-241-R2A-57 TaxID=3040292 RepID=UPI0025562E99
TRRSLAGSLALCESEATATDVFCAKAKRQQQYEVGHGSVITRRDALSLRSSAGLLHGLSVTLTPRSRPVSTQLIYIAYVLTYVIHNFW